MMGLLPFTKLRDRIGSAAKVGHIPLFTMRQLIIPCGGLFGRIGRAKIGIVKPFPKFGKKNF
jgi:hypothetical protein